MAHATWLSGESDAFIGRRTRLKRYLVCSMEGYFPVAVRTGPNSIAAIFRTGAPHIGITGTLAVSTSSDGGRSWSDPLEIQPRWDDNRNPAFGVNHSGELVAAFWKARLLCYEESAADRGLSWAGTQDNERGKTTPALYHCRSADGGRTWSEPQPYGSALLGWASPYGRIITAPDGALLMSIYGGAREPISGVEDTSILLRSRDEGQTWGDETLVAHGYNETSYAFLPNGVLIGAARSESGHVAILSSIDLGRNWSAPIQVTRDGEHPADLILLESGRLLLTFGRRTRPMGCGALLSADGGRSWDIDHEVLLAGDGVENGDLGYPSTVQLATGQIVTLLYYANGSEMTSRNWGSVSCQAIHYREEYLWR
jgi:hypothetical protein